MNKTEKPSPTSSHRFGWKRILGETLTVAVAGLAFALAANLISPRGLELSRNYFPGASRPLPEPGETTNSVTGVGTSAPNPTVPEQLAARIQAQGLQVITGPEVHQLFLDPRYAQELIVFVDARNQAQYRQGHIPGAYPFDHYRAMEELPNVLPACLNADQVVVYCTGGDCEDSEFGAITLRDAGIPADRLFVFIGGITEWSAEGYPVETGERQSGMIRSPTQ